MTKITKVILIGLHTKAFHIESSDIDPDLSFDERMSFYEEQERRESERKKVQLFPSH